MLTGGTDGTARLCNIDTHRVLSAFRPASKPGQARRESSIEGVAFCLSHPWCATTSTDGSVAVWDVSTNTCRHILYQDNAVVSVKFLPNLPVFATASVDATVRVYDSRNGKCAQVFTGHVDSILDMDVAVTKDADDASAASVATILSGGDDNVARVYRFDVEIA